MPILDLYLPTSEDSGECTPVWATPDDFRAAYPDITISDEDAEEILVEATWMLSGLIGDRFHDAQCWQDDYQRNRNLCVLRLRHQPVDTIFSVVQYDPSTMEEAEVDGWTALVGGDIRLCCRSNLLYTRDLFGVSMASLCTTCDDTTIRVQYRTKNNLPPGTKRQVLKLAREFWKSYLGQPCALPERITNVTRQGVSWVLLDPLDFLDRGLTGIGSVDQWISRVNMKGWAGLIDPLKEPPLLLSQLTGCGPACTGTGD